MGRKGSAAVTLWGGGQLGPLGRGLLPYHPAVWPQQTWAENWGLLCPFGGGLGLTMWPGRGLPPGNQSTRHTVNSSHRKIV